MAFGDYHLAPGLFIHDTVKSTAQGIKRRAKMLRLVIKVRCHCKNELKGAEGGARAFGDSLDPWTHSIVTMHS